MIHLQNIILSKNKTKKNTHHCKIDLQHYIQQIKLNAHKGEKEKVGGLWLMEFTCILNTKKTLKLMYRHDELSEKLRILLVISMNRTTNECEKRQDSEVYPHITCLLIHSLARSRTNTR